MLMVQRQAETALVKAALAYLKLCGFTVWRSNTGAMKATYKGKTRFVRFGKPGMSDIIGYTPDGRFFAAEAKILPNKPTPVQQDFLDCAWRCNCCAFWFVSLDDLKRGLEQRGYETVSLA